MRYILIILVFLSVGAKAQMVIKAHANYRPLVQPVTNLLLDDYPNAAAAYSLRKLDKDYAGSAIRVRRSNDNAESDIGFVNNYADTTAIKNFCGANAGNVVTWYDQSGNGRNISQSVASQQPFFWTGTAFGSLTATANDVRKSPSFATGDFGAGRRLINNFSTISQPITTFSVSRIDNATTGGFDMIYDSYNNTVSALGYTGTTESPNNRWLISSGTGLVGTTAGNTNPNLFTALHNGASSSIHINGTSYVSGNAGTNGLAGISVGDLRGNPSPIATGYGLDGRIAELIIYGSNQSSNRTGIENNINDYYNIYWNGDFTGLLDTYGSSAAAYSLRNLSSTYLGPLVRVRRSNDNAEQDIFGDYYGNLDTVGLKNFVGANSGFVVTWYDQSGNSRNATQSTAVRQPRVVNAGVVERQNGKVSTFYDGSNDHFTLSDFALPTSSIFSAANNTVSTASNIHTIYCRGNTNSLSAQRDALLYVWRTNNNIEFQRSNGTLFPTATRATTVNTFNLYGGIYTGTQLIAYNNGIAGTAVNTTISGVSSNPISSIGATYEVNNPAAYHFGGFISEIIVYNSDQSSNRTGIESNINTYYGIY